MYMKDAENRKRKQKIEKEIAKTQKKTVMKNMKTTINL